MTHHEPTIPSIRNCLLAALPHDDLISLWPKLEPVELVQRRVLAKQGDLIRFVIFPEVGWASNLVTFEYRQCHGGWPDRARGRDWSAAFGRR